MGQLFGTAQTTVSRFSLYSVLQAKTGQAEQVWSRSYNLGLLGRI